MQWIIESHGYSTNVGDDDPATALIHSQRSQQIAALIGDEINSQAFLKAGSGPVTVEPLGVFGPTTANPVVMVGWYLEGQPETTQELFRIGNTPSSNGLTVKPVLDQPYSKSFEPGNAYFGFYSEWPFFDNRKLFSEDSLNTFSGAIPHHIRVFPAKKNGEAIPNTYIIATEEYTDNFDFNDIVLLVSNVRPVATNSPSPTENSGLEVRNMDAFLPEEGTVRPGFRNDLLSFSEIRAGYNLTETFSLKRHNQVTVQLYNG